jgi:CheY-like chemotaxis protein/nitrogen-specific signal transduction histidine kinase
MPVLLIGLIPCIAVMLQQWRSTTKNLPIQDSALDQDEQAYAQASFMAKISHELRTPLHNIQGLLKILYKNDRNPNNRYYLKLISEASDFLLHTVNEILDYSKANTGMLTIKLVPTDLQAIIKEALNMVAPRAFEKSDLELLCNWQYGVPKNIITDGSRLRQILINLTGNAVKFTAKGYVKLEVSAEELECGNYILKFSVIDTGIGIPANKISEVFEAFNQVDSTIVRKQQGTGLGLTIVKQLLDVLGGKISVTSEIGKGSNFSFYIPTKLGKHKTKAPEIKKGAVCVINDSTYLNESLKDELSLAYEKVNIIPAPQISAKDHILEADTLIAATTSLEEKLTWELIGKFADKNGLDAILILLTPAQIKLRERCLQMGIKRVLTLPIISSAIIEAITNQNYVNSFFNQEETDHLLPSKEPLSILIADDMPTNQLILRTQLEELGHKVSVVSDGLQLFNLLKKQIQDTSNSKTFDIIFTDIQMPEMDGITAIRKTRELELSHAIRPLPLYAVTAQAYPDEQERIYNAGASGIINKPIDQDQLEAILNSIERHTNITI